MIRPWYIVGAQKRVVDLPFSRFSKFPALEEHGCTTTDGHSYNLEEMLMKR